jgi:hypothetical protein
LYVRSAYEPSASGTHPFDQDRHRQPHHQQQDAELDGGVEQRLLHAAQDQRFAGEEAPAPFG